MANNEKKKKLIQFTSFIILAYIILIGLSQFLFYKYELSWKEKEYTKIALSTAKEIDTLIQEKSESTMHLSLALANDSKIKLALINKDPSLLDLDTFSNTLRLYTPMKNVWMQILTRDGTSFYRSWTTKRGDNLLSARIDLAKFIQIPQPTSNISTGKFDLTFKAMVPIYSEDKFIGIFEIITHFNSIAKKIRTWDIEPVILVDRSYKNQLVKPFSKTFVNDYYVANIDADKTLLKYLETFDLDNLFKSNTKYTVLPERNQLLMIHTLNDVHDKSMAYFLSFKQLESIDKSYIEQLRYQVFSIVSILYVITVLGGVFFVQRRENRQFKKLNEKLIELNYKLKENEKLLDRNIIISSTDLDGNITHVSKAFCNISEYTEEELMGQNHRLLKHPDMNPKVHKDIWETITSNKTFNGEMKNKPKHGNHYWNLQSIYPIYNNSGEKIGYTSIGQDITDKKRIEELSITDGLTNIYNRRHFDKLFPKIIGSAQRDNSLVSFLIMDTDHFKAYNDTYGHQMGDTALIKVADCIKNSLKRADDHCFRLGGEEFGVIFKVDSRSQAISFANEMKQKIEDLQILHSENSASSYISVSMGLVCKYAHDIKNEHELYKETDDLLYKAKELGRNIVVH